MNDRIYGLVLSGGKSQRMGQDKSLIEWHGKPQKYYLADLLEKYCDQVYISCRDNQADQIDPHYPIIIDSANYKDSYGAIMSALEAHPDVGWLVVACDMPFVDGQAINSLIKERDPSKIATAYYNPANNLPEPLLAIWEPKSLKWLRLQSENGINCPRKALIKSGEKTKQIKPIDSVSITNVNTPEDAKKAEELIDENR